jgi:pimeloyl-ACP methyl ester carboxylesterase
VDGIRTHYIVAGDGPPVVLLHGLSGNHVVWGRVLGPLAAHHTVYAVDVPGRGFSEKPNIGYTVQEGTRFVRAFLEAVSDQPAVLVGNSMGGLLALRTALDHPASVAGLVLVGAAGLGRRLPLYVRLLSLPGVGEALEQPTRRNTRASLRMVLNDQRQATEGLLQALRRPRTDSGSKRAVLRMVRGSTGLLGLRRQWIMAEQLSQLHVPALLVWGARDAVVPIATAHEVLKKTPNLALRVIEDSGHWPQVDRPHEFNAEVLSFLERLWGAARPPTN